MSTGLTLELPPPLGSLQDALAQDAARERVSTAEYAKILICLAAALQPGAAERPFAKALRAFLTDRQLDVGKMEATLAEVVELLTSHRCDPVAIDEDLDLVLADLPPLETLVQRAGRARRASARGRYAYVGVSSEEFATEKREEVSREEKPD
ncbi:MAG: hypothetical protein U0835_12000 [Isosphaeraceae bacterium]